VPTDIERIATHKLRRKLRRCGGIWLLGHRRFASRRAADSIAAVKGDWQEEQQSQYYQDFPIARFLGLAEEIWLVVPVFSK